MSRPGPWHRARNPGLSDPEQGAGLIGEQTGPGIHLQNSNEADMWGAGARFNFLPRWQDQQGHFVNNETGNILGDGSENDWRRMITGHSPGGDMFNRQPVDPVNGRPPVGGLQPPSGGGSNLGGTLGQPTGNLGQLTPPGGQPSGGHGGDQSSMFPWLQRWTGGTQAPMSPYEQQGLTGLSNFVGGGMGLDSTNANSYLNDVIGGGMLNPNNPYFDQIQQSGQTLLQQSQDRTLREMQSRAAAGGNALSGALMQGEGDYLQGSNAAFQGQMAQMRADQYARERGYQQQAVGLQNQMQNQNAQTQMSGYGNLMGWGAVPRNIQTNEMQDQYADWRRQIGAMRDQYQYPDQMMIGMLGRGYQQNYQPQFGDSSAGQISSLLGLLGQNGGAGIDWGGIIGGIGGLFGGSGEQPQQQSNSDGHRVSYDGQSDDDALSVMMNDPVDSQEPDDVGDILRSRIDYNSLVHQPTNTKGHLTADEILMMLLQNQIKEGHQGRSVNWDASPAPPGPKSYQDSNYYNNALSAEQAKASAAATPKDPHAGANAGIGSAALLMQLLNMLFGHGGGGGKSKGGTQFGGGNGGNGNGNKGKSLWETLFPKKPTTPNQNNPLFNQNNFAQNYPDHNNPLFDPNNFAGNYPDQNNPLFDPGNYAGNYPDTNNPLFDPNNFAGGGSESDFNPFQGSDPGPWAAPDDGGDNYDMGT